jgi:hypothetical protein
LPDKLARFWSSTMNSRDFRLMSVPLIAAAVASALAWSAALLVIRRNYRLRAHRRIAKPSRDDVTEAEIEQALNQLRTAIAKLATALAKEDHQRSSDRSRRVGTIG